MQSRFEKNCATLRKVCASAKSFAEELSRPPKPACVLSSAGTRRGHFWTTDKTHALYSAADVPSSRAIQRGDGQAIRAVQRGKRTKLTRYTARRRPSHSRCTARQANQAHALYSAATTKPIALYSAANVGGSRARQRGGSTRLTRYPARGLPSDVDDADDELSLFSAGLFDFSTNACSFAFSLFSDCFSPTAFS